MVQVTVAFASTVHARDGIRFLVRSALPLIATPRPVGDDGDMALVDIRVPTSERARLATLLDGVHAFVLSESQVAEVRVA